MPLKRITENERKTYEFIKKRICEGYPPSVREICAHCGFRSTSTAHRAIRSLTDKGYLEKADNLNRAIRLKGLSGVMVPLLSGAVPNKPLTAAENISGFIEVSLSVKREGELFAVKADKDIPGHSVKEGDTVIFEKASAAESGSLAVFVSQGRLLVRAMPCEDLEPAGKAAAVLRELY